MVSISDQPIRPVVGNSANMSQRKASNLTFKCQPLNGGNHLTQLQNDVFMTSKKQSNESLSFGAKLLQTVKNSLGF